MIVDTSAIMALLLEEPEQEHFSTILTNAFSCTLSAGSWIELAAVLTRRPGNDLEKFLARVIDNFSIQIAPVSIEQAKIGHDAYRKFGRGTRHKADLNFGDCFAYALAKTTGEPLLFKGDDFGHTDIASA